MNNKLNKLIAEATEQVLNEISFEKGAAAYKKASDIAYNSASPREKSYRSGQAERLRRHLIDKYNKMYGSDVVKDGEGNVIDKSSHTLKDIGYTPSVNYAVVDTDTTDNEGGNEHVYYTKYNDSDIRTTYGSPRGFNDTHVRQGVSKRAQRGEKEIEDILGKFKRNESKVMNHANTIKLTESDLHNIIKESVKNVLLSEGMQWLGDFTQENVGSLKEMLEKQNGGSFNLNGIDFTIQPTQRGYHASSGTDWGYDALRVYDALRGCWQYSFHKNRGGWQN